MSGVMLNWAYAKGINRTNSKPPGAGGLNRPAHPAPTPPLSADPDGGVCAVCYAAPIRLMAAAYHFGPAAVAGRQHDKGNAAPAAAIVSVVQRRARNQGRGACGAGEAACPNRRWLHSEHSGADPAGPVLARAAAALAQHG